MSSEPHGLTAPPPGVVPNFEHPASRTPQSIALHTVMLSLSTGALVIRLYTRISITHQLGADDYLFCVGFIFTCAYSSLLLVAATDGFIGHHIWEIQYESALKGALHELYARFIYIIAAAFIKLSCMVFYWRFLARSRRSKNLCYVAIAFIISGYLAFLFADIFACSPVAKRFHSSIPGTCISSGITAYGSGALNVVTDILVVVFPLPIVWRLKMSLHKRLKVMAVFGLAIVVVAMSITRLVLTSLVFEKYDPTWELTNFDNYPTVELNIGLICACLLTFPAFIDRHGPRFMRKSRPNTDTAVSRPPDTTQTQEQRSISPSWTSNKPVSGNLSSLSQQAGDQKGSNIHLNVHDAGTRNKLRSSESTSSFYDHALEG